jgi:hypothetical protein
MRQRSGFYFAKPPCSSRMGSKFSSPLGSSKPIIPLSPTSSKSPSATPGPLSFTNYLTGRRVSLALVADGELQSPAELRAQIMRPLELIKCQKSFFAQRSPRCKHHRQQALQPLSSIFAQHPPCHCVPARLALMFRFEAFACQRLATAPADMHMAFMSWSWAEVVMERVTRGRVRRVQVRLQRRACCAVRCACLTSACVRCVFHACCSKLWLVLRCVAAHLSGCIKRAAAFILVSRLLLSTALQTHPTFGIR